MNEEQFDKMMALLMVNTLYAAVIAAQGHLQRPLTCEEYGLIAADVKRTAELLKDGADVGVLPPDDWRPPFWRD